MAEEKKQNWFAKHKVLTGILGVIVLIIIISAVSGAGKTSTTNNTGGSNSAPATKPAEPEKKKLSIDEVYGKIETGMSEAQVKQIVTSDPINCTESEMQGIGTSKFCTYGNVFTEKTSIMVTYMNGKVNSKTKSQY